MNFVSMFIFYYNEEMFPVYVGQNSSPVSNHPFAAFIDISDNKVTLVHLNFL